MPALQARTEGLLRWSEKYLKTDMVYFAKGGFWLFLAKVIALFAGFGMSIVFANLMEPEKYGVYKYIVSLVSIAGTFALVGMGTAVNQAVARGYEGALEKGFSSFLKWSIGGVVIAGGMAVYYFWHSNLTIALSLLIGGSLSPFISAASLYDNFLGGTQRFGPKTWYNALRAIAAPVVLIPALFLTNDPVILVTLYFLSALAATYFCYYDVIKRYKPHDRTDDTTLNYGKHLSVMSIITTVISQMDRVLVFSQLGGTALAIYSFAEAGPDQMRGLGSILGSLAFPKMSQRPFSEIRKMMMRKALIVFVAASFMTAIYIICAPFLFSFFFPKYIASVAYSQVYALIIPLALPCILFTQALTSHMKKRELYINNIVTSLLRICILFVLVQYYGIWGIVIGTIIYYVCTIALLLWTFYTAKA